MMVEVSDFDYNHSSDRIIFLRISDIRYSVPGIVRDAIASHPLPGRPHPYTSNRYCRCSRY